MTQPCWRLERATSCGALLRRFSGGDQIGGPRGLTGAPWAGETAPAGARGGRPTRVVQRGAGGREGPSLAAGGRPRVSHAPPRGAIRRIP
jgi:hypothetical protein